MTIIFTDAIGTVAVMIENQTEIMFFDGCIWFSGDDGKDYKIPFENVREIIHM